MKSPWVLGLVPGDTIWATVIEVGAPVWKRGVLVCPLESDRYEVRVEGKFFKVGQHDMRSVQYLLRGVS